MKFAKTRIEMIKTLIIPCPTCGKEYRVYEDKHITEYLADSSPLACECGESILCRNDTK